VDELTYQFAICREAVTERRGDGRLAARIVRPDHLAMQELFFHRSCLASALHESVPLGEVFEID
jgi:hypothetical protein